MARNRDCSSVQLNLFDESILNSSCGKMCQAHSIQTTEMIFVPSSKKSCKSPFLYLDTGAMQDWLTVDTVRSRGEFSTLNFSERPSVVVESFLSQILQADAPPKYYLSPTACSGILRRAREKGKTLPPELEAVLIAQSTTTTGKTAESPV